jgi:hypothetical protein
VHISIIKIFLSHFLCLLPSKSEKISRARGGKRSIFRVYLHRNRLTLKIDLAVKIDGKQHEKNVAKREKNMFTASFSSDAIESRNVF